MGVHLSISFIYMHLSISSISYLFLYLYHVHFFAPNGKFVFFSMFIIECFLHPPDETIHSGIVLLFICMKQVQIQLLTHLFNTIIGTNLGIIKLDPIFCFPNQYFYCLQGLPLNMTNYCFVKSILRRNDKTKCL